MADSLIAAAELGEPDAQFSLGCRYQYGDEVPRDLEQAEKWFRLAANQGETAAQFALAMLYSEELDEAARDYGQATYWLERSAEQGYSLAQYTLGLWYANGSYGRWDYVEASAWYRRAAENGYDRAFRALGELYRSGRGVLQDYVRAHMCLNIAGATLREEEGLETRRERDELASMMSTEQIALAQNLARRCQQSGYKECPW